MPVCNILWVTKLWSWAIPLVWFCPTNVVLSKFQGRSQLHSTWSESEFYLLLLHHLHQQPDPGIFRPTIQFSCDPHFLDSPSLMCNLESESVQVQPFFFSLYHGLSYYIFGTDHPRQRYLSNNIGTEILFIKHRLLAVWSYVYNLQICLQILILHIVGHSQSIVGHSQSLDSMSVPYWHCYYLRLDHTFLNLASVFLIIFLFSTSEVFFNLNFNASRIGQSFEYIFMMLNFFVVCNIFLNNTWNYYFLISSIKCELTSWINSSRSAGFCLLKLLFTSSFFATASLIKVWCQGKNLSTNLALYNSQ